jgi:2-oxoglutarate ferredoxin oxidoreductase subunit alpha
LAAQFNVPVILLSDKFIAESSASLPNFSQLPAPKIINSTKPLPGTPGQEYMANSYEHDDQGFSVEDALDVIKAVNIRLEQLKKITTAVPAPILHGDPKANKLIVTFGSPASTILEALKIMDTNDYALLQIKSLWPLHPDTLKIISQYSDITVVENNAQSQLVSLLKSQFDFNPQLVLLKYDGRPFFPEDLVTSLRGILSLSKETKQSL